MVRISGRGKPLPYGNGGAWVRDVQRDVEDAVPYGMEQKTGVVRKPREGQAPPLRKRGVPGCGTYNGTSRTPSPTGVDRTRPRNRGRLIAAPTGTDAGWRVSNTGRRGRRPLRDGAKTGVVRKPTEGLICEKKIHLG